MKIVELNKNDVNIVVNNPSIYNAEIIVEFEDGDKPEELIETFGEKQGLNPIYLQFVDYTTNLTNNELNEMAIYSQNIGGMAFRIVELSKPVNFI